MAVPNIPKPKPDAETFVGVKVRSDCPNGGFYSSVFYLDKDGHKYGEKYGWFAAGRTYAYIKYSTAKAWEEYKRVELLMDNDKAAAIEEKERNSIAQGKEFLDSLPGK